MSTQLMKIGELAKRAGVSHRTVHYYENRGLIFPVTREGGSHRMYEEEALLRLEKIAALKRLGLSLEEIADVIDLYFQSEDGMLDGKKRVIEMLQAQLKKVDDQIDELSNFRSDLIRNIRHMERLYEEAKPTKS
ncbi:MerR family transcriptional regulator [Pseudovibrio exalbescens]|uniref:helix-turn-helix domain-containing protein n=1 Tax=Pseudovibrio exalbescens TaxID=197461 RepID=UPI0023665E52|nr:MerR family transcriptional regulator [Pseudovibrio exalbescens]MDD7911074.1 MerR family transcriptional regulator [Pseudovibrio exalbescens]